MSSRRSRSPRSKNGHPKNGRSAAAEAPRNDVIEASAAPPRHSPLVSDVVPVADELALVDAAWDELLLA